MPFFQQASTAAGKVDDVFLYIFWLSAAFLVFITFLMLYFVVRYHHSRHPKGEDIEGNTKLEVAWTVIPAVLFLTMFYYGWTNYDYMRSVPRDAMVIEVTARQWAWAFTYPNGKRTTDLVLALNKPVKVNLHSLDVIHGFYIPAFRIKEDVVPGKVNYTWFIPTRLGRFDLECTVICGINHARMLAKVNVVPVADFTNWYFGDENAAIPGAPASSGAAAHPVLALLEQKSCTTCHSTDGTVRVGPTFSGMYRRREVVRDARGVQREVVADDAYLKKAIMEPGAEIVKGYPPVMPQLPLTATEVDQMMDYIKGLR